MSRRIAGSFRRHRGTVLFLWMALNIAWLAVIFVTDLPAWMLAIWIAATIGLLTALRTRNDVERSGKCPREIPSKGAGRWPPTSSAG